MIPPHDSFWVIPGRLLAGPYPGGPEQAEMREKIAAFLEFGVRLFVDLTEAGELEPYAHLLDGTGARHVRRPVRDVDVPTREEMHETLRVLRSGLDGDGVVYVHCWGGVGRTGTVVGCLLVEDGTPPGSVVGAIRELRRGTKRGHRPSPETPEQRAFVEGWTSDGRRPERPGT